MTRILTLSLVTASLLVATGWSAASSTDATDLSGPRLDEGDDDGADDAPTPCKRTEFKHDFVKKACADGGQKAAKKAMKAFVKKAKAATGEKITCKTCHSSLSPDYDNKPNANEQMEKLQKAIGAAEQDAVERALLMRRAGQSLR